MRNSSICVTHNVWGIVRVTWMKKEKKMITIMVVAKLSYARAVPMQKAPPRDRQDHSQRMRPRMPKYLAKTSDRMPPSGRDMMFIKLRQQ